MADRRNAAFDSRYPSDMVLATYEGTTGSISATNSETVTIQIGSATGSSGSSGWNALFQGIWSLNGTDWFDIGADKLSGSFVSEWTTTAWCNYGELFFQAVNNSGATSTVRYKIVIFDGPNQANTHPLPVGQVSMIDSRYTIQKIQSQDFVVSTITPGTTFTYTVAHNLGYVPCARGFVEFLSFVSSYEYLWDMSTDFQVSANTGPNGSTVRAYITADTSNVYFNIQNSVWIGAGLTISIRLHERVYYDD